MSRRVLPCHYPTTPTLPHPSGLPCPSICHQERRATTWTGFLLPTTFCPHPTCPGTLPHHPYLVKGCCSLPCLMPSGLVVPTVLHYHYLFPGPSISPDGMDYFCVLTVGGGVEEDACLFPSVLPHPSTPFPCVEHAPTPCPMPSQCPHPLDGGHLHSQEPLPLGSPCLPRHACVPLPTFPYYHLFPRPSCALPTLPTTTWWFCIG